MGYNLVFGSNSQTGTGVEYNSDALIDFPIVNGHVFVVSDGHNGEGGYGALAAKMCVESIKKYFLDKSYKHLEKALTNAIVYANYRIFEQAQKDSKYKDMAATVAVIIILKDKVFYAYAGDSRIYSQENENITLLTKDHINPENKNVYCLVGKQKDIKFGVCKVPISFNPKMSLFICTDGVTDVVGQDELKKILGDVDMSPEHKALTIVESAKKQESPDSITAVVVERASEGSILPGETSTKKNKSLLTMLTVAGLAILLGFGVFKAYQKFSDVDIVNDKVEVDSKRNKEEVIVENEEIVIEEKGEGVVDDEDSVKIHKPVMKTENIEAENNNGTIIYRHTVMYGQNLYRLGLWYGVPQDKIVELNGNKANKMVAGDILQIPITAIYKVKQNDTLESISSRYNVSASKIEKANAKDKEWSLIAGDEIVIPLP